MIVVENKGALEIQAGDLSLPGERGEQAGYTFAAELGIWLFQPNCIRCLSRSYTDQAVAIRSAYSTIVYFDWLANDERWSKFWPAIAEAYSCDSNTVGHWKTLQTDLLNNFRSVAFSQSNCRGTPQLL